MAPSNLYATLILQQLMVLTRFAIQVKLVRNKKNGKSRGYAFVEFERSSDLKEAYKDADGRKIAGRRILVDVERGRTVKNWRPRRLGQLRSIHAIVADALFVVAGGGLGQTRVGAPSQNSKFSGRCVVLLQKNRVGHASFCLCLQ